MKTTEEPVIVKRSARHHDQPLENPKDLDRLIQAIGDSRYVLLGEASHGTHEYYTWRTAISKRLIEERGFSFIAVEGDWPDCYEINRFVKGYGGAGSEGVEVLKSFQRWPSWMWGNWEVTALIEWMRKHNRDLPANQKAGFYGLDVYSLTESMELMVKYLEKEDPAAAEAAIQAFRCFEPYKEGQDYARAVARLSPGCRDEVLKLLREVRTRSHRYDHDQEAALNSEMNAQVIVNAEKYYRSMVSLNDESWNVRDTHMVETLEALFRFHGNGAKGIVWAHNTHVGDARYTDMRDAGLLNVGQLVRQQHKKEGVFIVGFASYEGTVIAGHAWGSAMKKMRLPPAMPGSLEEILHNESNQNRIISFFNNPGDNRFKEYLGHRAVGVVYHPAHESGNYVSSLLPSRYDALLYIDQSSALHPLHLQPDGGRVPETYPFGV